MNYKQIEEHKRRRSTLEWEFCCDAPTISENFPECKMVEIKVSITFKSAFGIYEKEYMRTLFPKDKLHLHYDCVNRDCTGYGFSLTSLLTESLLSKSEKIGELRCEGKEDWKYQKSSGNTCLTTLKYRINPIFTDIEASGCVDGSEYS